MKKLTDLHEVRIRLTHPQRFVQAIITVLVATSVDIVNRR
jgi:hypothetical protein